MVDQIDVIEAQEQLALTISHFSEALRIQPDFADKHHNLGTALGQQAALRLVAAETNLQVML